MKSGSYHSTVSTLLHSQPKGGFHGTLGTTLNPPLMSKSNFLECPPIRTHVGKALPINLMTSNPEDMVP